MKRYNTRLFVAFTVIAVMVVASGAALAGSGEQKYAVTITNLTRGQIMSPPVLFTHDESFALFTPGQPASPELAAIAEDADSGPLVSLLMTDPGVSNHVVGPDVIMPGQSMTLTIETSGRFREFGVAGMLVTTNDAFYAAGGNLKENRNSDPMLAIAWDAGSEANTEACTDIPGPPCGNPFVRVTTGAEGYVHVHAGVHGIADLMSAQNDWRNPVALVTVQRIN